jgi:hypothetical protein
MSDDMLRIARQMNLEVGRVTHVYSPFNVLSPGLSGISGKAIAVTPSNTVNFRCTARYLYVGSSGDVAVVQDDNSVVIYKKVPAGTYLFVGCKRVNQTGTTAKDIIAHY